MNRVYAVQLSNWYPSATLPLSIGTVWGYAYASEQIQQHYTLIRTFWENETADQVIDEIVDPDVLICSCYIWNWERTNKIIKKVKEHYPDCLVVIGGPEPKYSIEWMNDHPHVDVLIPYYGEVVFRNVLIENLSGKDFESVNGTITKHYYNRNHIYPEFSEIPSPYLNGYFDDLLNKKGNETRYVRCVFETNRGCPYSCTFCDIGVKEYQKVRNFDLQRTLDELEWIVRHGIPVIDVADSNFGIMPRDEHIVDYLIELKNKHKWQGRFVPTWSKAKGDRIIRLAKKLIAGGLDSIFGLSLQSLNQETLDNIKRTNPFTVDEMKDIIVDMNNNGIDVYTELIFPLPGDTLENFKSSLYTLLDMPTPFNKLQINQLSKLTNTEFNTEDYDQKYKTEWATIKGYTRHYYGMDSTDTIAIANCNISVEDTFEGLFFSKCIVIPFYYYGIIKHLADTLQMRGINRSDILKRIEDGLALTPWFIEFKKSMKNHYMDAIAGRRQFGFVIGSDPQNFSGEYAAAHKTYVENNIYNDLRKILPEYVDLITIDENSRWTGVPEKIYQTINGETWLFEDDRNLLHHNSKKIDEYEFLNQIYLLGRFDERWRKKIVRKI